MAVLNPAPAIYSLGLTGYPLGHSLSPRLHTAALRATELSGDYRLIPISPFPQGQAGMLRLLEELRMGALHGLNVTIPHKQNVIPLLDELTPAARAIGAVNTIYLKDSRLVGDNTDAAGFSADLARFSPFTPCAGRLCALVMGAGGSAHAVVYALSQAGWQISIAARRPEQASALATRLCLDARVITVLPWEPGRLPQQVSLIVNTTPLGMSPNIAASPWPDAAPLPPQAFLYDLVYNPPETLLLRQARAAGLQAANGLGMLVEQAVLAFEIWTGRRPPRQALWDAAA